jgi:4a-hydroxytetrahydrobiopterin dehydratase
MSEESKERVYEADEIEARLKRELPHWRYENGWIRLRIPRQSGQGFRFDVGHRSDLIPATIPK